MFWEIDQRVARNKQPTKNTKVSTQETPMKDPKTKKPKTQAKPACAQFSLAEIFNKACKEKKNDRWGYS